MRRFMIPWSMSVLCLGCAGSGDTGPLETGTECVVSYSEFSAKEVPKPYCCDGSKQIALDIGMDTADPDECGYNGGPDGLFVCLPCGNGTCDAEEHLCNCPEDCSDLPD